LAYGFKGDYYNNFFWMLLMINLLLLLMNLGFNALAGNECGVTSVRGLIAVLLTLGIGFSIIILKFIEKIISLFQNRFWKMDESEQDYITVTVGGR
jgi:nitric oxide reductase large subunit